MTQPEQNPAPSTARVAHDEVGGDRRRVVALPPRQTMFSGVAYTVVQAKRSTKAALGRMLLPFAPRIRERIEACGVDRYLSHWRDTTLFERLVLEGLIAQHTARGTGGDIARSHHDYWSGAKAVAHHKSLERRFASMFLGRHFPVVEALDRILATGRYHTLCEIGCGSGLVADFAAKRWPFLRKVIGLDLSAEQVALNRKQYADPRLHFVAADASAWIPAQAEPGTMFFTYDGVLEYFPEASLQALLAALAGRAPVGFAMVEPIAPDYDLARESRSRLFGGEMSFTHNYPKLFADAGFDIRWQQELPRGRHLMIVATRDTAAPAV